MDADVHDLTPHLTHVSTRETDAGTVATYDVADQSDIRVTITQYDSMAFTRRSNEVAMALEVTAALDSSASQVQAIADRQGFASVTVAHPLTASTTDRIALEDEKIVVHEREVGGITFQPDGNSDDELAMRAGLAAAELTDLLHGHNINTNGLGAPHLTVRRDDNGAEHLRITNVGDCTFIDPLAEGVDMIPEAALGGPDSYADYLQTQFFPIGDNVPRAYHEPPTAMSGEERTVAAAMTITYITNEVATWEGPEVAQVMATGGRSLGNLHHYSNVASTEQGGVVVLDVYLLFATPQSELPVTAAVTINTTTPDGRMVGYWYSAERPGSPGYTGSGTLRSIEQQHNPDGDDAVHVRRNDIHIFADCVNQFSNLTPLSGEDFQTE
ncbi:MAG TPA: hypothetical protein VLF67_03340 [Candidatus Saccharimonas sp.]|nr:hypothetical protein [Candidatus Saccharimonas sp.]